MKNILFITNIIPEYRVTFYEKLCSNNNYKWLILRGKKDIEDGRPDYKSEINIPDGKIENKELRFLGYTVRWQRNAIKHFRHFNPDLIILSGIAGVLSNWVILFLAKYKKIPVIMWNCGWEAQTSGSLKHRIKIKALKIYYNLPQVSLVYSSKAKKYLMFLGIAESKLEIAYNGMEINTPAFYKSETVQQGLTLRKNEGLTDSLVFIFVGGMLKEKKVDFLIEVFKKLRKNFSSISLWLVGDGPDRQIFETTVKQEGIEGIRFWGRMNSAHSDQLISASDFLVLPGIGGLAINHAMFWGVPCIVSQADGTEDDLVIDGFNGLRFENNNFDSLYQKMEFAATSQMKTRVEWKQRCLEIIENQSNVDIMVKKFHQTIDRNLS